MFIVGVLEKKTLNFLLNLLKHFSGNRINIKNRASFLFSYSILDDVNILKFLN